MNQNEYYQNVAEKIIDQLKAGTAPWQKPWQTNGASGMPHNPVSGSRYRGGNSMVLMVESILKGYEDSRWMTYEQSKSIGGQVRRGEKGTLLRFYKFTEETPVLDDKGQPTLGPDGRPLKETVQLSSPKVMSFVVFNAAQIDNLPPSPATQPRREWEIHQRAESILGASGAKISFGGNNAFYSPKSDEIRLPPRESFRDDAGYYATAMHELGHWSGSSSRLDRDLSHPFGSAGYAKEELRAEIFSMMLGHEIGIGHDPGQHAAYVGSWIKALEEDHREIFRAAADAEKMLGFVLSIERDRSLNQSEELGQPMQASIKIEPAPAVPARDVERIWLTVPFSEKDEAKSLGAKWDKGMKSWFTESSDTGPFQKWIKVPSMEAAAGNTPKVEPIPNTAKLSEEKTFLSVPYLERNEAKKLGAKWDKDAKLWYAPPGEDISKFDKWLTAKTINPVPDPGEEFAHALKAAGLIIQGVPVMDGTMQRVPVEGGQSGARDGAYKGHLDGHPAGYMENFRTGHKENWKSQGFNLSEAERGRLQSEASATLQKSQKEREEAYQSIAYEAKQTIRNLTEAPPDNAYLIQKGLSFNHGALSDPSDSSLVLPATDIDGKVWSFQKVHADGSKAFAPGGKMAGCMFVAKPSSFNGLQGSPELFLNNALSRPQIFIAEGFATAASLSEALNSPVIAAFSAGNLKEVANAVRKKVPNAAIVICGDDDQATGVKRGVNCGKEKALAAAEAVKGRAVFPIFAPGADKASDFNDLHKSHGLDTVKLQLKATLAPKREIKRTLEKASTLEVSRSL